MSAPNFELKSVATQLQPQQPQAILQWAMDNFDKPWISFSGAEDVVLIDIASKISNNFSVFSLDTGRLHAETYRYIETVREHYNIDIELLSPNTEALQELVKNKGLFSFYKDGHKECCAIRKVQPLRRKLATVDAWITGQRQDQSETRAELPVIQHDQAFSTKTNHLIKFNPLSSWSSAQTWAYIRKHDVPYNELHARGFVSIGCEPCTRPVLPNQHERVGRWWWENPDDKECGLHVTNLKKAVNQ